MSTLDRGGAESMVMSLLRNMDRELVQFDFIKHTNRIGAFEYEIESLGGKIYTAPRYRIYNHLQYVRWWKKFLIKHPEYYILHGHFFSISSIYFSVAQQYGRITIGHSHCTEATKEQIKNPVKHYLSNLLVSKIEKYSDYCFACSIEAGKWIFKKKPFVVLNNAINTSLFCANKEIADDVRKELLLGDALVLGNVSRFDLQKNPYGTLEIFRLVHEKRPNSKLLWVGDGPLRVEIEKKAIETGIFDHIVFTGVRSDVYRLLQGMDAFILPSFFEGLPVSAIEAQAAGLYCFISDKVTKEVAITDMCHFLTIDNMELWADEISKLNARYEHPDTTIRIKDAGYDIRTSSKWLQNFYISLM